VKVLKVNLKKSDLYGQNESFPGEGIARRGMIIDKIIDSIQIWGRNFA